MLCLTLAAGQTLGPSMPCVQLWANAVVCPSAANDKSTLRERLAFLCAQIAGGTPGWARLGRSWSGRTNITGPCWYLLGRNLQLFFSQRSRGGINSKGLLLKILLPDLQATSCLVLCLDLGIKSLLSVCH